MTSKDFEAIAAVFNARHQHNATDRDYAEGWHAAVSACAHAIADDVLAPSNPRFDRERFLAACGIKTAKSVLVGIIAPHLQGNRSHHVDP